MKLTPWVAVQPLDLVRQLRRVAVPPLDPEAVLTAVGAAVGAAPRELHDRRPPHPEAAVVVPALDQFPADPPPVEVRDRRSGVGDDDLLAVPEGEAGDPTQVPLRLEPAGFQRPDEFERGRLPLAPDDEVDRRLLGEDAPGVVGRVDAPVDRDHAGAGRLDRPEHADAGRVGGGRPGVTGHHHVRSPSPDLVHDRLQAQAAAFRVQEPHLMTGVDEGTADHQQPERDLVTHPEVRGDGLVRGVDEEDFHRIRSGLGGGPPRRGRSSGRNSPSRSPGRASPPMNRTG